MVRGEWGYTIPNGRHLSQVGVGRLQLPVKVRQGDDWVDLDARLVWHR